MVEDPEKLVQELLSRLNMFSEEEVRKVKVALKLLFDKQYAQKRKTGESYTVHPMGVALKLIDGLGVKNIDIIISALLHDILEDTDASEEYISKEFGDRVLKIVKGLTYRKAKDLVGDWVIDYQQHVLKEIENEDVFLIKLCDMENNAFELQRLKDFPEKQKHLRRKYMPLLKAFADNAIKMAAKYKDSNPRLSEKLVEHSTKLMQVVL